MSVTSFRNRAAQTIGFAYDNLNRVKSKDLPGAEPDVAYAYDNLDRLTAASQSGNALAFGYDALSRKTSEGGPLGTTAFGTDLAGRRTSIVYPGTTALTIAYAYLVTGELLQVKQSSTVLADYAYDNLGNRLSVSFGNGASQSFGWDAVSRLASLTNSLTDANDLSVTFGYNPASQIASTVRTGDMYAWTGHGNGSTAYTQNGLNQQVTVGGASASWDSKGNLTSEPQSGKSYGYTSENLLTSSSGGTAAMLSYDPALRLYQVAGSATARFLYDGTDAIAEYNGSSALQRRFVFDPTTGQPVLWYEGSGTASTDRRYLSQDERGSVISVSDSTGASLGINTYDEYGKPGAGNIGRFQYAGQKWIGDAGVYDYHYRDYVPELGIFAQTDPIGYAGDGPNLYAYVLNDPVNYSDKLGLEKPPVSIIITGQRPHCSPVNGCYISNPFANPVPIPLLPPFDSKKSRSGQFAVFGPDASSCSVGPIEISSLGMLVGIGGNIAFPNGQSEYLGFINEAWTGQFGSYTVLSYLSEGPGGLTAFVEPGPCERAQADLGGPNLYLRTLVGGTPHCQAYEKWSSGHEFGHSLRLTDRYFNAVGGGTTPYPGYSTDIMAAPGGTPSESDVSAMLSNCA